METIIIKMPNGSKYKVNCNFLPHRGTGKDAKYPNAKFCIEDVFDSKGTDVENFIEDFELWDKINELVLEQIEKERAQNGN